MVHPILSENCLKKITMEMLPKTYQIIPKLKTINQNAKCFNKKFHNRLSSHSNPIIKNLSSFLIPGGVSELGFK
jgi:hypothetical protein